MKYEIYRTINLLGRYVDALICITYTEDAAHEIVKAFREKLQNQTVYFKEVK